MKYIGLALILSLTTVSYQAVAHDKGQRVHLLWEHLKAPSKPTGAV